MQFLGALVLAAREVRRLGELPVPVAADDRRGRRGGEVEREQVTRRQLRDALERRLRRQRAPEGENLPERARVETARDLGQHEEGLHFRRDGEAAADDRVEDRPDAHAVARDHQSVAPPVVQRDRELAVQVLHETVAVLLVEVDDHLRVGVRVEAVPLALEVAPQLDVVEDLAVEDDPDGLVLVVDRLPAALEVDDREAGVGEAHASVHQGAEAVGAAMLQGPNHRLHLRLGGGPGTAEGHKGRESAHSLKVA